MSTRNGLLLYRTLSVNYGEQDTGPNREAGDRVSRASFCTPLLTPLGLTEAQSCPFLSLTLTELAFRKPSYRGGSGRCSGVLS